MVRQNVSLLGSNPLTSPGLTEMETAPHSGLRCETMRVRLFHDDDFYVSRLVLGAGLADTPGEDWYVMGSQNASPAFTGVPPSASGIEVTALGLNMPVPCTPVVRFQNTAATFGQRIALRLTGLDQFGMPRIETTPFILINTPGGAPVGTVVTYFWLSKVFSRVDKIEYRGMGLNAAQDSIEIGFRHMWETATASLPAQTYLNFGNGAGGIPIYSIFNQGIGLPFQVSPYTNDASGINNDSGEFEILAGYGENLSNGHQWVISPYKPVLELNKGFLGGWLIGQSDKTAAWQGDSSKFMMIKTSGLLEWRRLDNVGAVTLSWGHQIELTLWVRTSRGTVVDSRPGLRFNERSDTRDPWA